MNSDELTTVEERRILAGLPPDQVGAVRRARRRAGELISERGWIQGREWSPDGYCISGALYAAAWEAERTAWNQERISWTTSIGCSGSGIGEYAKRQICMELGLAWQPAGDFPGLRAAGLE